MQNTPLLYLDATVLLKLVFEAPETYALQTGLQFWPTRVSSLVVSGELLRATYSFSPTAEALHQAQRVVSSLTLLHLTEDVMLRAAQLSPGELNVMQAFHLASAIMLGGSLGGLMTYDPALATAAAYHGLRVTPPPR